MFLCISIVEFSDFLDFIQKNCVFLSMPFISVVVLDHHKTALERLCGDATIGKNVTSIIDMERSGATIAFDYFTEKIFGKGMDVDNHYMGSRGNDVGIGCQLVRESEFARVHRLFKYIEDGDLWRWAVPDSKAFSSGLKDLNIEYSVNLNPTLFEQVMSCIKDCASFFSFLVIRVMHVINLQ